MGIALANEMEPNELSTEYYISYDLDNEYLMYSKNIDEKIAPASITKAVTALVLLDYFDINESVTVTLPEGYQYSGKVAYLESGMYITIEDLLEFLLIYSANDAAHVAAMVSTGSVESFVKKMNDKAKVYGMNNTTFQNPDGLDQEGHLTTLRDLLNMSLKFVENYKLLSITSKNSFSSDVTGVDKVYYSTNELIGDGYIGIKTGWTSKAGLTFIGLNLNNDRQILTIVNNSIVDSAKLNHFKDTEMLYKSSYNNYGNYESFDSSTEVYKIINPNEKSISVANESWEDFVDLRTQIKISFSQYVDGRLNFKNNISSREVRIDKSSYEVKWDFKILEFFSVFAN